MHLKIIYFLLISSILTSCDLNQKKQNQELPGRLGNKDLTINDDKRIDQNLLKAMIKIGLDGIGPAPDVKVSDSYETKLNYLNSLEPTYQELFNSIFSSYKLPENVETKTEKIIGDDGNEIKIYISKPKDVINNVPAILHLHGGGMAMLTANDSNYIYWRHKLASKGLVVIGVEFRNIGGAMGNYPFPSGLNDCLSALKWVYNNKEELGISKIIISGESGGGNLSIATVLKAKDQGIMNYVDGVYAQCPYISNLYGKGNSDLKSLVENDTYFLRNDVSNILASLYDGIDSKNPFAWPYHAEINLLKGLPPHVITVNELDPLRDEGIAFSKKLEEAGVSVRTKIINGTVHAAENIFPMDIPEIHNKAIEDIKNFSYSLE